MGAVCSRGLAISGYVITSNTKLNHLKIQIKRFAPSCCPWLLSTYSPQLGSSAEAGCLCFMCTVRLAWETVLIPHSGHSRPSGLPFFNRIAPSSPRVREARPWSRTSSWRSEQMGQMELRVVVEQVTVWSFDTRCGRADQVWIDGHFTSGCASQLFHRHEPPPPTLPHRPHNHRSPPQRVVP